MGWDTIWDSPGEHGHEVAVGENGGILLRRELSGDSP